MGAKRKVLMRWNDVSGRSAEWPRTFAPFASKYLSAPRPLLNSQRIHKQKMSSSSTSEPEESSSMLSILISPEHLEQIMVNHQSWFISSNILTYIRRIWNLASTFRVTGAQIFKLRAASGGVSRQESATTAAPKAEHGVNVIVLSVRVRRHKPCKSSINFHQPLSLPCLPLPTQRLYQHLKLPPLFRRTCGMCPILRCSKPKIWRCHLWLHFLSHSKLSLLDIEARWPAPHVDISTPIPYL